MTRYNSRVIGFCVEAQNWVLLNKKSDSIVND